MDSTQQIVEKIVDLLERSGYDRARTPGLSPFDVVTGGLAWCVMASNEEADVGLLYDDEATLGDKM